jgi:hypothetical protein
MGSAAPTGGTQAWDVLFACQGQLRLAPSGHIIGIDMHARSRSALCPQR